MKYAISALLGSLVSTVAVVAAGHAPALLVVLGFVTACGLYTWVLRVIGLQRLVRWSHAGKAEPETASSSVGEMIPVSASHRRQFRKGARPVTNEDLAHRYQKLSAKRRREMALDMWAAHLEGLPEAERNEIPDDVELFGEKAVA